MIAAALAAPFPTSHFLRGPSASIDSYANVTPVPYGPGDIRLLGGKCHGATPLCIDPSQLKTVVFKERAARGR